MLYRNTAQVACFKEFIERNNLHVCWDNSNASRQSTYANYALMQFSCIDYFLMSNNLFSKVQSCSVNTSPLNPSDHRDIMIYFKYELGCQRVKKTQPRRYKVSWQRVNNEHIRCYQAEMDKLLESIDVCHESLTCNNPVCCDVSHTANIEHLCEQLISTCIKASEDTLPKCVYLHTGGYPCGTSTYNHSARTLFWHFSGTGSGLRPVNHRLAL